MFPFKSLTLLLSKAKYFSPALVFATLNIFLGTWAIFIPEIKSSLNINEGQLGFAIFFMALGTLTMLLLAPGLIRKLKVGKATAIGVLIFIFSFLVPFGATNYYILCLGMYLVGASSGFTDIAMNTLVTEIEKEDDVHIMSANHGFFSLGGFIGAGLGGLFLSKDILPLYHLLVVIAIMLVLNLLFIKNYIDITSKKIDEINFSFKNLKPLLALVIIGFFVMASEGAIVDWSALYLNDVSRIEANKVGLGYTIFSLTMALGRFLGDSISKIHGSKRLIIVGLFLGVMGFAFILLERPFWALTGFGFVGLGLSVIVPELFRIGGKLQHVESSQGVSAISGSGFLGFLVGPVLLGFLAEMYTLKLSFFALLSFILISFFFALKIKR